MIVNKPEHMSDADWQWSEYNRLSLEYMKSGDFAALRGIQYEMSMQLKREGKHFDAIRLLMYMCCSDLAGVSLAGWYTLDLFDYGSTPMSLAPGIVKQVGICQRKLKMSDDELKGKLLSFANERPELAIYFSADEMVDIFFLERDGEKNKVAEIYKMANKRHKVNK